VNITCRIHGDFKPATLYYLKVVHSKGVVYKIGLTNNSLESKYRKSELEQVEVIFEKYYENGIEARLAEKEF